MPLYLSQFQHAPDTWARLIANPEDRRETLRSLAESVGGKLVGYWYAFGLADGYVLIECPDDVTAASILVKVASSGRFTVLATTKLLSVDEMLESLGRADKIAYRPPGGEEQ